MPRVYIKSEPQYIEKIDLQNLRSVIMEKALGKKDAILLNQFDFDALAEEHREMYGTALEEPYYIEETLLEEDNAVPTGQIVLSENTTNSVNRLFTATPVIDYRQQTVYRCNWCGNVVNFDGTELKPQLQTDKIDLLEKHIREITVKHVAGYCCPGSELFTK